MTPAGAKRRRSREKFCLAAWRIRSEAFVEQVRGGPKRSPGQEEGTTRYLISFDDGAMTFPEDELPDVANAAHEVVQVAKDAGVWVFGGGG